MKRLPLLVALMLSAHLAMAQAQPAWQTRLRQEMPLLGHRNWIMIVDSAYPLQSGPGVETIETHAGQVDVIRTVLKTVDGSIHVRPVVFMDAELPFVPEKNAPGVTAYRAGIKTLFSGAAVTSLPHEQIISKVNDVGKTFHILVLKTTMTVPYTSVFLELNCKYWSDEAEAQFIYVIWLFQPESRSFVETLGRCQAGCPISRALFARCGGATEGHPF